MRWKFEDFSPNALQAQNLQYLFLMRRRCIGPLGLAHFCLSFFSCLSVFLSLSLSLSLSLVPHPALFNLCALKNDNGECCRNESKILHRHRQSHLERRTSCYDVWNFPLKPEETVGSINHRLFALRALDLVKGYYSLSCSFSVNFVRHRT